MRVARILHLPVDRQRDDRVACDSADFAERRGLRRAKVLEDLQGNQQVVAVASIGQGVAVASCSKTVPLV